MIAIAKVPPVVVALIVGSLTTCAADQVGDPTSSSDDTTITETPEIPESPGAAGQRCQTSMVCDPNLRCIAVDDPKIEPRPTWGICAAICVDTVPAELRCLDDAGCCRGVCTSTGLCQDKQRF